MNLEAIQAALREAAVDGWLFYDHHHRDPIAAHILGVDPRAHITRRWYYFIPAVGEPRKLVHRIEQGRLDTLPGAKGLYSSWQELHGGLEALLFDARRIAMQYSPNNAIMYVSMVDAGTIGEFDSPADYLPSLATQQNRRSSLPDRRVLQDNVRAAAAGLDLQADQLSPFIDDVEAARQGALVTVQDLHGTSLAAGFGALILHQSDHWNALLPLHAVNGAATPDIDVDRVTAALGAAHLQDTHVLDLKDQTDALYASYLQEAIRLSLCGFALILLLLLFALRSPLRVARVLAPLVLAVLAVAAGLAVCGQQLTILHLVGMLLIVAVGSNYALFFDDAGTKQRDETSPLTLASLGIANLSTVIGFGLLSFSQVPVLEALGETVAPGAFLALVFSAVLTSRPPPAAASADTADA